MNSDPGKLLIIDDHASDGASTSATGGVDLALRAGLARRGYSIEVARDGVEALDKIRQSKFDLVVLDQLTPGSTESDLLHLLHATYSPDELPVVVVTEADREDSVQNAAARIETQLSRARALHRAQNVDGLTGLANRAALLDQLRGLLKAPFAKSGTPRDSVAVLLLDLDGFRRLNVSLGDTFGNGLLIETARRVEEAVRSTGWETDVWMARVADDEFAVAGPRLNEHHLDAVAAAILHALHQPFVFQGFRLSLSASIGIALVQEAAPAAEDLLRDAYLAMERARQLGGHRHEYFDQELRERAQNRVTLALELHDAIEQNQLFVVYQPKINLLERRVEGFEALLRWRRSNGEIVPPMDFIPIAEDTGSIREIGVWVLRQACRQLAAWQKQYPSSPPLTMNVNVSARQLTDASLVQHVREILAETEIRPETLNLELTESALMSEVETGRLVLENLRALNIGLKLDDFGTGFSSLSYLRAMHFDCLKIAPCFITKLATDYEARVIVESIVTLAHALHMHVVAEGIETEAQLRTLEELGCDLGQGYLFYKPLGAEAAADLLQRGLHRPKPGFPRALDHTHSIDSMLAM